MSNVKILRITTETYSLRILLKGQLKFMSDQGMDVYMASTPDSHVSDLEYNENGKFSPLPLSRELTPLKDLVALFHTILLIRKIKPDIVHTHSPKAGIVGMLAAFLCRVPVKIHTVAGLPLMETTGFKRKLLNAVEYFTYWCADWVLPNSQELKNFILENKLSLNRAKVQVMGNGSSNGIDLQYFSTSNQLKAEANYFRQEHQITEDKLVLTFMGRLAFYKGINELVKAFLELQQEYNDLTLVLVGAPEELNPLSKITEDEINKNPNIIAVGHQKDVRKFLVASDIFVFPSYREGFPQALMQACAMGLPSIATNINGCNELIDTGVNGLLIEPKNHEQIVKSCKILINDKSLRLSMGDKAKQYVAENFEQQNLWFNIYKFYLNKLKK
jgi:glycosyltransferase involved in cell wall biosynthesis